MKYASRVGLVMIAVMSLFAVVALAHGPMDTMSLKNNAQPYGAQANSQFAQVQDIYADELVSYAALANYDNPNWSTQTRQSYQAASAECASIITHLNGHGFFDTDALDEANSWWQAGLDYMSFGQWDLAYAAFENCWGSPDAEVELDYSYLSYIWDYQNEWCAFLGHLNYMEVLAN